MRIRSERTLASWKSPKPPSKSTSGWGVDAVGAAGAGREGLPSFRARLPDFFTPSPDDALMLNLRAEDLHNSPTQKHEIGSSVAMQRWLAMDSLACPWAYYDCAVVGETALLYRRRRHHRRDTALVNENANSKIPCICETVGR